VVDGLPHHIEAYLKEANFSSTEILVLKRLLQDDALTLRELSMKTGKSAGVLDQSLKKLGAKHIVSKEGINDTTKYSIKTLEAVLKWMEQDVQKKHQEQLRKHKDFETFVHSLTIDKKRPEMHYYNGDDGIMQAYRKLLELVPKTPAAIGGKSGELLHYLPVRFTAEEDPMRDFNVEYFRERRRRGIFSRVVTHNTSLGRRFQSRDPFEYRKTILVEEEQYPFEFERVIAGDTIACFNHKEKTVCFIDYPELVKTERDMFEKLWAKKTAPVASSIPSAQVAAVAAPKVEGVTISTRTLSGLREFFLTKKSIATFMVFGVVAAAVTYGLWQHNVYLSTVRIQDKALSIAATAALQFDANDLDKLRTTEDIQKPEYSKVIYLLNEIRRQNEDVKYIYIMRPTNDPNTLEFVADADSIDPFTKKDLNSDGEITDADWLSPPGELYDVTGQESIRESLAGSIPTVDEAPYTDQWGTFISGHAPIKDANGNVAALLGVDIFASKIYDFTNDTFYPFLTFLGLFLLFIIIRLAAFNRSLFKELWEVLQMKRIVAITIAGGIVAVIMTMGLYWYGVQINTERVREKVTSIAATSALQFSADELKVLRSMDDVHRPEYKNVTTRLDTIRKQNSEIIYMYIIRPTGQKGLFTFVADADAIDPFIKIDTNEDGKITEADTLGLPGLEYETTDMDALIGEKYSRPVANSKPYTDKWGSFITGYAPIRDAGGNIEAVIAVDMWADKVYELTNRTFSPIYVFLIFFIVFLIFRASAYKKSLLHQLIINLRKRSVLITIAICASLAFLFMNGLYFYTLFSFQDQLGKTLEQIIETNVKKININHLNKIQKSEDMQKPEYQEIFQQINSIRGQNDLIRYVYIHRPTEDPNMWNFVADADTNYYLPFLEWDFNRDGKLDAADEAAPPGTPYNIFEASPKQQKYGLQRTVIDTNMEDQWGKFFSATTPIKDSNGNTVAVLGVDVEVTEIYNIIREKYIKWLWFLGLFTLFLIIRIYKIKP